MIYKCRQCGSTNIQIRAWVGANDNTVHDWCDGENNQECWCEECQKITKWRALDGEEIIPTDELTKDNIEVAFVRLVEKYGRAVNSKILYTSNYCSDYGLELANSTIDVIYTTHDNRVIFVYNYNTLETDAISAFKFEDLKKFYDGLLKVL